MTKCLSIDTSAMCPMARDGHLKTTACQCCARSSTALPVPGLARWDAGLDAVCYGLCRAQEVLDRMGIKASRQYMKQPRNTGGMGQGKQHQNGVNPVSSGVQLAEAEGGHVQSNADANGLTGTAEDAVRHSDSEAHANGRGLAEEAVPLMAATEPSACADAVEQEEQQLSVKRQRVDEGAVATAPVGSMGETADPPAVLFDVAQRCKQEVKLVPLLLPHEHSRGTGHHSCTSSSGHCLPQ